MSLLDTSKMDPEAVAKRVMEGERFVDQKGHICGLKPHKIRTLEKTIQKRGDLLGAIMEEHKISYGAAKVEAWRYRRNPIAMAYLQRLVLDTDVLLEVVNVYRDAMKALKKGEPDHSTRMYAARGVFNIVATLGDTGAMKIPDEVSDDEVKKLLQSDISPEELKAMVEESAA